MSLNAATIEILIAKGLSATDILDVARASECKADRTNAERQARHRERKRNAVTVTPAAPNDIYSNPENPSEAKASPPPIELKLVSDWNAGPAARGARRATKLDASRKSLLKARLRDNSEAEVFQAMANLAASRFHCGENDRNWRASLGWFLKAENFLKALEMADAPVAKAAPASREAFEALCDREIERLRRQGNEREALVWEAKKRGEERRTEATGPPGRPAGALIAGITQRIQPPSKEIAA